MNEKNELVLEIESDQTWQLEDWGLTNHHDAFRKAFKTDFQVVESGTRLGGQAASQRQPTGKAA